MSMRRIEYFLFANVLDTLEKRHMANHAKQSDEDLEVIQPHL